VCTAAGAGERRRRLRRLSKYPRIPGVKLPLRGNSRLPVYDYGPEFDSKGIVGRFPPEPVPGSEYPLGVSSIG